MTHWSKQKKKKKKIRERSKQWKKIKWQNKANKQKRNREIAQNLLAECQGIVFNVHICNNDNEQEHVCISVSELTAVEICIVVDIVF